ncbi:MAG: beta-propeller fold lactonase family protein [Alphaproteobacteria bacterium]|nr:beta-propeller fold lactonase family protein [Alphaproteobacteria bacterium]
MLFEAGPVRPVAVSTDGSRLLVTNIPDDRLEVFDVGAGGTLTHVRSIEVGQRPVAVAFHTDGEAWVVNHLSDSVSVVDVDRGAVTRTLLVGDEPRDLVFAGGRAFVTTAHRGQQRSHPSLNGVPGAGDPQLTTAGVDRADVWVFDADDTGGGLGGVPERIVTLFGDTPRALTATPDGSAVYAAIFQSGNRTAVVPEGMVCNGFGTSTCNGDGITSPGGLSNGRLPGGLPGPSTNHEGAPAPETGLIVQQDIATGQWRDTLARNWSNGVRFNLPDLDVFRIDTTSLAVTDEIAHVGTTIFGLAVNPVTGRVYASNTEAGNLTRFEGPGVAGGSTVQGDLARSRITVIDPTTGSVQPRALNTHIDYALRPAPPGIKDASLATPLQMVVSSDGTTVYVAAYGSGLVGVLPTADLEAGTLDPLADAPGYIPVTGGGPGGLALDEAHGRLFVYTRFDDGVSVVDTTTGAEVDHRTLYSPEPASVVDGRPVLYDAHRTSSNGEASCASCHIFGDDDQLAWDLGDPDGNVTTNPATILLEVFGFGFGGLNGDGTTRTVHPMKGPMTTQSLRGLSTSGAMHWRGDRSVGFYGTNATDETLSFRNFVVAFGGLVGDDRPVGDPEVASDIDALTAFALQLSYPPNPVRALDNSLTLAQQRGHDLYLGPRRMDGLASGNGLGFTCEGCHRLDASQGFYGTGTSSSFENEAQILKVPHLRNLYTKVGMFGSPDTGFVVGGNNGHTGDQIRGTGMSHDGSIDTVHRFLMATVFNGGGGVGFNNDTERLDMEQFLLAFDSDLAPAVGQQVTVRPDNLSAVGNRVVTLLTAAGAPFTSAVLGGTTTMCDLVVRVPRGGRQVGFLFDPASGMLTSDSASIPPISPLQVRWYVLRYGVPATFTCVPPGSGVRMALDRDLDGVYDGDELAAGTDPADPTSH